VVQFLFGGGDEGESADLNNGVFAGDPLVGSPGPGEVLRNLLVTEAILIGDATHSFSRFGFGFGRGGGFGGLLYECSGVVLVFGAEEEEGLEMCKLCVLLYRLWFLVVVVNGLMIFFMQGKTYNAVGLFVKPEAEDTPEGLRSTQKSKVQVMVDLVVHALIHPHAFENHLGAVVALIQVFE
jgi:hypothetical protein